MINKTKSWDQKMRRATNDPSTVLECPGITKRQNHLRWHQITKLFQRSFFSEFPVNSFTPYSVMESDACVESLISRTCNICEFDALHLQKQKTCRGNYCWTVPEDFVSTYYHVIAYLLGEYESHFHSGRIHMSPGWAARAFISKKMNHLVTEHDSPG